MHERVIRETNRKGDRVMGYIFWRAHLCIWGSYETGPRNTERVVATDRQAWKE